MNHYLKVLFSSILAGILISIGGFAYICVKNISIVIGGFLFAFGLFTIISLKLHLYTGKIGYLFNNKLKYLLELLIILLGNAIGAISFGYLSRLMLNGVNESIMNTITNTANYKLSIPLYSSFILSVFCGIMIFLAVEVSRRNVSDLFKVIAIFFAVAIFIISGFEHCIANMFFFSFASSWSIKALSYILIMILGNSIGSIAIYLLLKLTEKTKKDEH